MTDKEIPVMIGMPVFNAEKHLPAALDSILNQTYQNFEVVISDNASTDTTPDICSDYERRDSRIRIIRQKVNLGGARNFNFVGRQARGAYFKWAASNDVCEPRMLEVCIQALEERPDCVLAYPEAFLIEEGGKIISEYEDPLEASDANHAQRFVSVLSTIGLNNAQSGLIRSEALPRTRLEGVYAGGDVAFMAELALQGKFVRLPERLFMRRVSPESSTIGSDAATIKDFNQTNGPALTIGVFLSHFLHLVKAVKASELPVRAKAQLYMKMSRRLYWGLPDISKKTYEELKPPLTKIFSMTGR